MYNKSELSRMINESHENGSKILVLQDQMNEALTRITHFLKNTMDVTEGKKPSFTERTAEKPMSLEVNPGSKQTVKIAH